MDAVHQRSLIRDVADSAVGSVLALAALGFGVVGWLTGLFGNGVSSVWFFSAAILGILSIGIVLDESRLRGDIPNGMLEASLSWLLAAWSLGMGIVGFVAGIVFGSGHSQEWLLSGIIVGLVSVAVMADEGRRRNASNQGAADEAIGGLLALLAIGVGVVGFVLGVMGSGSGNEWLYAGIIAGLAAVAFMFDGERRAAVATSRTLPADIGPREQYHPPLAR